MEHREEKLLSLRIIQYGLKHEIIVLKRLHEDLRISDTDQQYIWSWLVCNEAHLMNNNHIMSLVSRSDSQNMLDWQYRILPTAINSYIEYIELLDARKNAVEARKYSIYALTLAAVSVIIALSDFIIKNLSFVPNPSNMNDCSGPVSLQYVLTIVVLTFILRGLFSLLRVLELKVPAYQETINDNARFPDFIQLRALAQWWALFIGFSSKDPKPDHWYNTAVGTIELFVFPLLIAEGRWEVIGGWLVIKSAITWSFWTKQREVVNRFFLGSATNIAISLLLARAFKPELICFLDGLMRN